MLIRVAELAFGRAPAFEVRRAERVWLGLGFSGQAQTARPVAAAGGESVQRACPEAGFNAFTAIGRLDAPFPLT